MQMLKAYHHTALLPAAEELGTGTHQAFRTVRSCPKTGKDQSCGVQVQNISVCFPDFTRILIASIRYTNKNFQISDCVYQTVTESIPCLSTRKLKFNKSMVGY